MWDAEINNQQFDHFGALQNFADGKRIAKDSIACPHRPDRESFVSRRSIFSKPRARQECLTCAHDDENFNKDVAQ